MQEFLESIYFKWLLIDFFSFFLLVYIVAFSFTHLSKSTRLEETALKGYLTGILLHIVLTIVFLILTAKSLYDAEYMWDKIWAFDAGFIIIFILEIIFAVVIWLKIKALPYLVE